jgi:predicted HTH domain antitoxin
VKRRGGWQRANDDAELLAIRERDREVVVALFDRFEGRLVSPGGAASLLGVTRQTINTLEKRGHLRAFRAEEQDTWGPLTGGPKWVYIPLEDVEAYAERVGRPLPRWARRAS